MVSPTKSRGRELYVGGSGSSDVTKPREYDKTTEGCREKMANNARAARGKKECRHRRNRGHVDNKMKQIFMFNYSMNFYQLT